MKPARLFVPSLVVLAALGCRHVDPEQDTPRHQAAKPAPSPGPPAIGPPASPVSEARPNGDAGAIAGVLRTSDGAPLGRAWVRLKDESPGCRVLGAAPDATGRYVIQDVPPGVHWIEAEAEGYLLAVGSVEVRRLETSEGNDLVLEPAPTVSGVVLDKAGDPIEGARIQGWPSGGGRGTHTRSAADGSFTLFLPQNEPYELEVRRDGFAEIGDHGIGAVRCEPGAEELTIRMERPIRTTFVVLDARTEAPVERFGLRVQLRPRANVTWALDAEEIPLQGHAGGTATTEADPARHAWQLQAPGYAPRYGQVRYDEPGTARQTIHLEPEGVVRGRVVFHGAGADGAEIRIERCPLEDVDSIPGDEEYSDYYGTYDLDGFTGRARTVEAAVDGTFKVGGLASGTYSLTISFPGAAPHTERDLPIEAGEVLDLGALELANAEDGNERVDAPDGYRRSRAE